MNAGSLLESFAETYLWADPGWLVMSESEFCYWQARLAQTVSAEPCPDGTVKWRISTTVVEAVEHPAAATELCCALNAFTAGWSFAYDPDKREIRALIAMSAPPEWDRYLLRLSEAAKLSSWFSDVIAERLADVVSGRAAFTHPETQPGLRELPDATYHYLETLRGRPEWVVNLVAHRYPDMETIGGVFAERMGATADVVDIDDDSVRIAALTADGAELSHMVQAGFADHPLFGLCWHSRVEVPGVSPSLAARVGEHLTWVMFLDSTSNLLGGWTRSPGGIGFEQWSTGSELRSYEKLPSFLGRHIPEELWGLTSTLISAISHAVAELPQAASDGLDSSDPSDPTRLEHVLGSFARTADGALTAIPTPEAQRADRRLLWLRRRDLLVACVWFNPMGPTVSSLEVCTGSDPDRAYLVEFMRHPFSPEYRVLAELTEGDDQTVILSEGLTCVFRGSLPNAVSIESCPERWRSALLAGMEQAVHTLIRETEEDPAVAAARIAQTLGRPWDWASLPAPSTDQHPLWDVPAEQGYELWLNQATNLENVAANFWELPNAWDGSLNFQASAGNLNRGLLDIGPLLVTYSEIGRA